MRLCGRSCVAWSLITVGLVGCDDNRLPSDAGTSGVVLARVGDEPVMLDEVERELRAQPEFMRARLADKARKREYVEGLIRNRLLVAEARRQKLDRLPEVQLAMDRVLVQQLLKQLDSAAAPTDAEVQAWYDEHVAEFSRPERVQVSVVEFGGLARGKPASRAEVEKEVARLRALKEPARRDAFLALVQTRSTNDASRSLQGDVGPRTREELTQLFGASAAQSVFSLAQPGDLSLPVETPRGFVIFRLTSKEPAQVRDFASEKQRIIARLSSESRSRRLEVLTRELREKGNVSIDETVLEKLDAAALGVPLVP